MVAVPGVTPVTMPVPAPTVAMVVEPLVHAPPEGVEPNVVVLPWHTVSVPVITEGWAFIVIAFTAKQPDDVTV